MPIDPDSPISFFVYVKAVSPPVELIVQGKPIWGDQVNVVFNKSEALFNKRDLIDWCRLTLAHLIGDGTQYYFDCRLCNRRAVSVISPDETDGVCGSCLGGMDGKLLKGEEDGV